MKTLRIIASAFALGALIAVGFMYTVAFAEGETYLHTAPYIVVEEPLTQKAPVHVFYYRWTMEDDRSVDLWEQQYDEDFIRALDEAVRINERIRRAHRERFSTDRPALQE